MNLQASEFHDVLSDLHEQGLTVRLHLENSTWHISNKTLYSGYVVSTDELIELKRAKKLNFRGIENLG